jgi:20S proteasome subunit alpha 6
LVAGIDRDGPHLYETCPSGNYYEYKAYSIGARSQSARTYLEDNLGQFTQSTLEELVLHSLAALKKSASEEGEVKAGSIEVGIVGKNRPFSILKENEIAEYLTKLENFKGSADKMEI